MPNREDSSPTIWAHPNTQDSPPSVAVWLRRDLRTDDSAALYAALQDKYPVVFVFIFDPNILATLPSSDRRVRYIYERLQAIQAELLRHGSSLVVAYGNPAQVWKQLVPMYRIAAVHAAYDGEPYARARDAEVQNTLHDFGVSFTLHKDQTIWQCGEIFTQKGTPHTTYAAYAKAWKAHTQSVHYAVYPSQDLLPGKLAPIASTLPSLEEIGFASGTSGIPPYTLNPEMLAHYAALRDRVDIPATSGLSVALRFGAISIRQVVQAAYAAGSEAFLSELIWREFVQDVLGNFPHTATEPWKATYQKAIWRNNPQEIERWKAGTTGYPLVDAGMRQLAATGSMPNRVRMVVASFLVKHLLIDWRIGERYFAEHLADYDLAANAYNWQWIAGCGVDACPPFRIFNPSIQAQKFDPNNTYQHTWIDEYGTDIYPKPMIEHAFARARALDFIAHLR